MSMQPSVMSAVSGRILIKKTEQRPTEHAFWRDRIRPEKLTKDQSNLLCFLKWAQRTGAVCSEARCIFTEGEMKRERDREN